MKNLLPLPYKLVLGSKSPRRKELLEMLGLEFRITSSDWDEEIPESIMIKDASEYLANEKAKSLLNSIESNELLITADTLVLHEGRALAKPADEKEAFDMINGLSDDWHEVTTGVSLTSKESQSSFSNTTRVHFKKLSDGEIKYYIKNFKPFDKAGSYGIQEWIGLTAVDRIEGCFFNVIGLPVPMLYEQLKLWCR